MVQISINIKRCTGKILLSFLFCVFPVPVSPPIKSEDVSTVISTRKSGGCFDSLPTRAQGSTERKQERCAQAWFWSTCRGLVRQKEGSYPRQGHSTGQSMEAWKSTAHSGRHKEFLESKAWGWGWRKECQTRRHEQWRASPLEGPCYPVFVWTWNSFVF